MDILNTVGINIIKINWKKFTTPPNPIFFILLIVKSFEILTKTVYNHLFHSFLL